MTAADPPAAPRAVVVMPTFDEAESLPATLAAVRAHAPEVDVLVVDDASPDGTGRIAAAIAADDPRIRVLHRSRREGLGAAYLAGFAEVLGRSPAPDLVVEMDADGSHPADALPRLLAPFAADGPPGLVIGSRWVPGGRIVDWPRHRSFLSRVGNRYARLALDLPVADLTAGFRAYRADALAAAIDGRVASHGYCFQIDLARRVAAAGFDVVEEPITFREREHGRSKMTARIVVEAMVRVTGWGLRRLLGGGGAARIRRGKATRNPRSLGGIPQRGGERAAR